MMDSIAIVLLFIGLFFIFTASVGILKFRDTYTRLHAASKGATFGFAFIILGVALMAGGQTDMLKALTAIVFQIMTAPIGAHMVARAAMQRGVRPVRNPQGDPLEDVP